MTKYLKLLLLLLLLLLFFSFIFFSLSRILKYIRTFAFKFRRRRDNILKQKIFTEEELRIRHEQTEEAIGRDVTARDEISEVIGFFFFFLNAANTPLYGSCKLETRSVSSVVVRKTSIKYVYIRQYALEVRYT